MSRNPYEITVDTIKEPPVSFHGRLKFLGPGFILSASIVGSGELIATTTLGANAGFVAFWIIIVSCLVKVAVQIEFGKHAILTGETAVQAFGKLPGPSIQRGKWAVWIVFIALLLKLVQIAGILGGSALILNQLFGGIPVAGWAFITAFAAGILIYQGYYKPVERVSLFMIAIFTILTLTSLFLLSITEYHFSFWNVLSNQRFDLSATVISVAVGAFGITGVASDEIIAYTYWCIEKGYAAFTGPRNDSTDWSRRARGWINVMYLDATFAMILYTSVTAAFYLLGAAVLHHRGEIPDENHLVETLALIYTQSLGPGSKTAFLIGGFFVLYSSLFASLAAWSRVFPDIFGQLGWIDFHNMAVRNRIIGILSWIFPAMWLLVFLFIKLPLVMILSGGFVGSFLLLVVAYGALHLRYKRFQLASPSRVYDTALWISVLSILALGAYGLVRIL